MKPDWCTSGAFYFFFEVQTSSDLIEFGKRPGQRIQNGKESHQNSRLRSKLDEWRSLRLITGSISSSLLTFKIHKIHKAA